MQEEQRRRTQAKPRVGMVLMRADWSACGETQAIQDSIQADTNAMLDRLGRYFEIQGPWVIHSAETLQTCQRALREASLDLVLLAFQTWSEDIHLAALLQAIGTRPLVLWCYVPWRRLPRPAAYADMMRGSGPVGTFGALGTLRNLDVPFLFTFGAPDDPRLLEDLLVAARAASVRQGLREARFGLLPTWSENMQSTYVDEFRLMADFGPTVQYLPVSDYQRACESIDAARVENYLKHLRSRFPIKKVESEILTQSARAALGLAKLAQDHQLDVLALNDASQALKQLYHLRPALYPALIEPLDILFQPEADLGAATANYILHCLTHSPTMFLEFWSWDEAKNQLIGGHAGLENPDLAEADQVCIASDFDFCRSEAGELTRQQGAQYDFIARPGRVTLFQLRSTPKGWQAIAASGMCLEGQTFVEGHAHALVRLDTPVEHFLNRLAAVGATQHWIMAYGSVLHEIEALCQMEKLPLELLSY